MLTFVCLIAIAKIFMEQQLLYGLLQPLQLTSHYYSCWHLNAQWWLTTFYGLLQLTTFVWTIATEDYCMLQTSNNNVSYIDCTVKKNSSLNLIYQKSTCCIRYTRFRWPDNLKIVGFITLGLLASLRLSNLLKLSDL